MHCRARKSMSLRCLALLALGVLVLAEECPRSHCSNHGKCVQDDFFEICLCDDDDHRGHFAGNKCQHCLEGFRPPACVEIDLLPDTTWLLLMALAFVFISCGGVLLLRFTCYLTNFLSHWMLGTEEVLQAEQASDDEAPAFPIIDPGNDSEEEQRKAEALAQRQMLSEIAGEERKEEEPEDDTLCKICFTNPSNCVLLDCGHLCTCFECGVKLKQCPFCRKAIEKVKKIYRI